MRSEADEVKIASLKETRRQILRILHIAGPIGSNERTMLLALNEMGFNDLPHDLRRHLDYLEGLQLLKIVDRERPIWAAQLTPFGTDVMEGVQSPPPGVAK